MPELRHDPLTGDWIIVAPQRASRPHAFARRPEREATADYDPDCPFCRGNEEETPEARHIEPASGQLDGWAVRVVNNKYPMLDLEGSGPPPSEPGFFECASAAGHHEVIIETPYHNKRLIDLSDDELLAVGRAYRNRFSAMAADPDVRHVVTFRNHGPLANASIPHLHSQLVALQFVPPAVQRKLERVQRYADEHAGDSLLLQLVEREVSEGSRIIDVSERFASFVPYAATHDYEVWIAPRFIPERFDRLPDEDLQLAGLAVRKMLVGLDQLLGDPDYNLILHTPPLLADADRILPWYVQIIPRLTATAGFEIGAGVHVNITSPERAANALKAVVSG